MKLNTAAVYSAYLAGYLGVPFAGAAPLVELEPLTAYALGVHWRGEPSREPESLASVVRKVCLLLAPIGSEANKADVTSWFTDPSHGARLRRTKGTR